MKSIGGDFDISPDVFLGADNPAARSLLPSCGRAALYQILLDIRSRTENPVLLVPDYTCSTVPNTAAAAGVAVVPYPIGPDLRADRSSLEALLCDDRSHLLLTDYFGLVPLEPDISWVRSLSPTPLVIEDDSQAPFALEKSLADYAFTSYRKAFAVADGADIRPRLPRTFQTDRIEPFVLAWSLGAIAKHLAQTADYPDEMYLRFFEAGVHELDSGANLDAAVSCIGWRALHDAMSGAAERRRANFRALEGFLEPLGVRPILELSEDRVPLFVPVLVQRRDEIRRKLMDKRIFCPVHWPERWAQDQTGTVSRRLYEHELSLVIDQRYDTDHMWRIAHELEAAGVEALATD